MQLHSDAHKETYDALADEYESRVEDLIPITSEAMDYFASYLKPGGRVLDIGCAVGIAMSILNQKGFKTTGIEISPKMARFAKERNPDSDVIVGDFTQMRFDEKFDGALAFAFIHLFPKKEVGQIFVKIKSILNPGGVALFSTTVSAESKEGWYEKEDFNRKKKRFRKYWMEKELEKALTQVGFKVLGVKKFVDPIGKTWMDFIVQNI
ncbi:MAG: methyltransferase domain-containing protein [Patescibacteria group bacterium]|nr:class I SAM-dependent methyltransferase [Patescibacteria group bacterium]MDE1965765.1 methyltransferase domain-containing protein [Patescibacteria group bacterium]